METYLTQSDNFEPSIITRFRWTRIRKKDTDFNTATEYHFVLPGLYNYNAKYSRDRMLFIIALIIEIWGLWNIASLAINSPLILVGVPIAFTMDITFAIMAHWYAGKQCELRNKKFLAISQNNKVQERAFISEYNKNNKLKYVFNFLIIVISLVKSLAFIGLNDVFDLLSFGITTSYVLVAAIHIFITGHFLAEWHFRRKLYQEKNQHEENSISGNKNSNVNFTITKSRDSYKFKSTLKLQDSKIGEQQFKLLNAVNNEYQYCFNTWGILQDHELFKMINDQEPPNRLILGFHGINYQLQLLTSPLDEPLKNLQNTDSSPLHTKEIIADELSKTKI